MSCSSPCVSGELRRSLAARCGGRRSSFRFGRFADDLRGKVGLQFVANDSLGRREQVGVGPFLFVSIRGGTGVAVRTHAGRFYNPAVVDLGPDSFGMSPFGIEDPRLELLQRSIPA